MKAFDVMTPDPVFCTPDATVQLAAQLMVRRHCGALPVVESLETKRLIGIVTDRDITCRVVAMGLSPDVTEVRDCMSSSPATVLPETSLETCCRYMETHQVRRLPVVDNDGRCIGIIAQADIAARAPAAMTVEVVRDVSMPTAEPRRSIVIAA